MPDALYPRIIEYVRTTAWALLPQTLAVMVDILRLRAEGHRLTPEEISERIQGQREDAGPAIIAARGNARGVGGGGGVAVIPLVGAVVHRADAFEDISGFTSVERFRARLQEALNNDAVGSIVIDVDSPGGSVSGITEIAQMVRDGRESKKIVAVANTLMASAAYWIASAASEIVATPSANVGAIGVFAAHADLSTQMEMLGIKVTLVSAGKFKVEGNPFEPLDADAEASIQRSVDESYGLFTLDVAKGRGVTVAKVRSGFGEGRLLSADEAKAENLVDRVATLAATVQGLLGRGGGSGRRADEIGIGDQGTELLDGAIMGEPNGETTGGSVEAVPGPSADVRRRKLALFKAMV